MTSELSRPYASSEAGTRLYQGEIFSNVVERFVRWLPEENDFGLEEVVHPYAVMLTQDCDLEQDARVRTTPDMEESKRRNATLKSVLFVEASEFERATCFASSEIKRRAKQNKDERYQFLGEVVAAFDSRGNGVPSLLLDFKRIFTYRTDQLLLAIERAETLRHSRLLSPYVEHLSSRFGYFMQRIGLPQDHHDF